MKNKIDQQIEDCFYYAVNFYNTNDRSLEKQQFCLTEMQKYGLDLDTCIRIQNPVMSVFQMGELMQIGSELTQQHLNSITNNIRQHLLGLQPTLKPETIKELPNIPTLGGAGIGSNKRDIDGVSIQVKNIVQDITTNGYKSQKALVMSNYDLEAHDMNYLSGTMPSNKYNFTLVDFSHNPRIKPLGLDYLLKGAPGISNLQQGNTDISVMYQGMLTRPNFNIVKLNLENCNLGDTGADILGHCLISGKLPSTKEIDVSGNGITETGWEFFAAAVKKVQAKTVAIKVATADTLQDMKEFLNKGFKYYTQTHKVVATKEFQDELLGVNISNCDKTRKNVKEAFLTGVVISSLSTGNDVLIFFAGAEAGAGALLSPDTANCLIEITGKTHDLLFNDAE